MVDDQPKWRTGKICYIEVPAAEVVSPPSSTSEVFAMFSDPAGNILGIYQQPGLAEAEEKNQHD
jgi:hypothetical protein